MISNTKKVIVCEYFGFSRVKHNNYFLMITSKQVSDVQFFSQIIPLENMNKTY